MKIESLREFVTLSKHLNYTLAAKDLYISQPTLSLHITRMEKELGFDLVSHEGPVQLTPAGEAFLEKSQGIIAAYDDAVDECRHIQGSCSPVRIQRFPEAIVHSLVDSGALNGIPFTVCQFDADTPLLSVISANKVDLVLSFDYRIVPSFAQQAESLGLRVEPVAVKGRVNICMMKSNPLSRLESLKRQDLRGAHIVTRSGQVFDGWSAIIRSILHDEDNELGVTISWLPMGALSNLEFIDLGDTVYFALEEVAEKWLTIRDDVRVFDRLDGKPILYDMVCTFRSDDDNPNTRAFVERLVSFETDEEALSEDA